MKVLLVNGSPHPKGCTYVALNEISTTLKENSIDSEIFQLNNTPIASCIACMKCRETKRCFRKDAVNDFIELSKYADGFVFGSPIHYAAASGAITSFLDRVFYAAGAEFKGKPGAAIVSCRRGGAIAGFDQLNKYFTISNMPIVSSQYWNQIHGNSAEEARQDAEGLQTMRTLGRNMAWLLKCIEAGKAAGIPFPVSPEEPMRTNFIR